MDLNSPLGRLSLTCPRVVILIEIPRQKTSNIIFLCDYVDYIDIFIIILSKSLNINLFTRLFLNKMFSFGAVSFTRIVFSLWKTGKSSEEYVIFGCTHD